MPSKVKTSIMLILYCISLAIIAILFISVKTASSLFVKSYSYVFLFLFASVFLSLVSFLKGLWSKEKNKNINKILNIMSILLSCIGLVITIINLISV
ncbi:ABC-type transport system involved in multi-copper enzyme maturation permease subunit [Anaerocolumna cellulosilytica]|nr:ABC-type transport system involved in multi-copper enzyme maturation permease subunit [Anaerocolumna cellulosilytica]